MSVLSLQLIIEGVFLLLLIQTVLLLIQAARCRCRTPASAAEYSAAESSASTPPVPTEIFPGISVTDHATVGEQHALLERLASLPQIRRLSDGSLVDWMSGATLSSCDCGQARTLPHLQLVWAPKDGLGMISRGGLAHYLAYQERLAQLLLGQDHRQGGAP